MNNFDGAKEFVNSQVRNLSTVEVQTEEIDSRVVAEDNTDQKQSEEVEVTLVQATNSELHQTISEPEISAHEEHEASVRNNHNTDEKRSVHLRSQG